MTRRIAIAGAVALGVIVQAQTPATPQPAPTKWIGGITAKSQMDDTATAVFRLRANNTIQGWLVTYRPTLFARCKETSLDFYIDWGMPANVEYGDTRSVRLRIDSDPPIAESWDESTDDEALFAPRPGIWMHRIAGAKQLRVEFTPFKSNPQVAVFDVAGFKGRPLTTLEKAGCGAQLEADAYALAQRHKAKR